MRAAVGVRYGWRNFFGPRPYPFTLEMVGARDDTAGQVQWVRSLLSNSESLVLDAGCGNGRHSTRLALHYRCVVGVDASLDALRSVAKEPQHVFVNADTDRMPFRNGSFDAILSLYSSLGYNAAMRQALREMRRVIRSGGILILDLTNDRRWKLGIEKTQTGPGLYFTGSVGSRRVHLAVARSDGRWTLFGFSFAAPRLDSLERAFDAESWRLTATYGDSQGSPYNSAQSPRLVVIACAI